MTSEPFNRLRRHTLQRLATLGALALTASGRAAEAPVSPSTAAQAQAWPEWSVFRDQFVSDGGRVIDLGSERSQTFSEGQGYALFFALVADDRAGFEKVLRWTEDNLCDGDLSAKLPAWLWGHRDDDSWGVIDSNSASDADLWIAYALGEAGRLWSERRFLALSKLISARILREETLDLPGLGPTLLPAAKGFVESEGRWRLNPSYMPMQVMRWFAAQEPLSRWPKLAESSRKIIVGSAPKGFAPDWIVYDAKAGFLPDSEGPDKGRGAYNAIRVYLWAGMLHAQASDRTALLQALAPMAAYVRDNGQPPESIDILTGRSTAPGPSSFSAAVLPFLESSEDTASLQLQQTRLQARPIPAQAYYGQALGLFGLGWLQGRYRFGKDGHLQPRWKLQ